MLVKLIRGLVVIALNSGFFEGTVQALDLAIGPRVGWFGQAMLQPGKYTIIPWDYTPRLPHVAPHKKARISTMRAFSFLSGLLTTRLGAA